LIRTQPPTISVCPIKNLSLPKSRARVAWPKDPDGNSFAVEQI